MTGTRREHDLWRALSAWITALMMRALGVSNMMCGRKNSVARGRCQKQKHDHPTLKEGRREARRRSPKQTQNPRRR